MPQLDSYRSACSVQEIQSQLNEAEGVTVAVAVLSKTATIQSQNCALVHASPLLQIYLLFSILESRTAHLNQFFHLVQR
jgi:hypothetical protein